MPRSGHRPPPGQPWRTGTVRAPAQRLTGRAGADALTVLRERCPAFLDWAVRCLTDARGPACLRTASEARRLPDRPHGIAEPGEWRHGWQHCASRTRNLFFREHRALLRSQAGPHAAAWLQAIPSDPHTSLTAETMQIALRRRRGSTAEPGCGRSTDAVGDHAFACSRTGLLARRAKLVERAWCKVACEAVGPEGHVVPQQWLVNTTAPGIAPDDRRRLDLVIYGATPLGGALSCDATLVSPMASPTPAQPRRMERFCAPPTDASKPPTLSSRQVALKSFACSAAK